MRSAATGAVAGGESSTGAAVVVAASARGPRRSDRSRCNHFLVRRQCERVELQMSIAIRQIDGYARRYVSQAKRGVTIDRTRPSPEHPCGHRGARDDLRRELLRLQSTELVETIDDQRLQREEQSRETAQSKTTRRNEHKQTCNLACEYSLVRTLIGVFH